MTWLHRYLLRNYRKYSIWLIPFVGILTALLLGELVFDLDKRLALRAAADPTAARDVLVALATSMFTLIVFVSSSLLLAIQLASAQLTPRVISLVFQDLRIKLGMLLFSFAFTFSLAVAVRIRDAVPMIAARGAAWLCILSLAYFLYLVDHVGKFLRPSGVLRLVFAKGRRCIESLYPRPFAERPDAGRTPIEITHDAPTHTLTCRRSGVVLAVDSLGLATMAEQQDCLIELVPQVGDYVASGEVLFRVFRAKPNFPTKRLDQSIALGMERTIEQDPAFALRIMVDIANKGLSSAINDPTTAVLAIDQIHRLLRIVGQRNLNEGPVADARGHPRFLCRTPDWEDFVSLAVTEIRLFGGASIQIVRRLRAMLENLAQTLPAARAAVLEREMTRLRRTAERCFPEVEDRALAHGSDTQGVGGAKA